jgi:hypothetical protein
MKRVLPIMTALIATFLLFSSIVGVSSKASDEEEITNLIETAATAEDHTRIAEYYEKQAEKAERTARFHESMAKSYRERSKPLEGLAKHCSNLAKKYEEAADRV